MTHDLTGALALAHAQADFERCDSIATAWKLDSGLRREQFRAALTYVHALLANGFRYEAEDLTRTLVRRAGIHRREEYPRQCAAEACLAVIAHHTRTGELETAHRLAEDIAAFAAGFPRQTLLQPVLARAGLHLLQAYGERCDLDHARAVHAALADLAAQGTAGADLLLCHVRASILLIRLERDHGDPAAAARLHQQIQHLAGSRRDLPQLHAAAAESLRLLAA